MINVGFSFDEEPIKKYLSETASSAAEKLSHIKEDVGAAISQIKEGLDTRVTPGKVAFYSSIVAMATSAYTGSYTSTGSLLSTAVTIVSLSAHAVAVEEGKASSVDKMLATKAKINVLISGVSTAVCQTTFPGTVLTLLNCLVEYK